MRKTIGRGVRSVAMMATVAVFSSASEAQRIVSVSAQATEILMHLGAAADVVAADATSAQMLGAGVPDLGYHRQLSVEGLLAAGPELLIHGDVAGPLQAITLARAAGTQVLRLPPVASAEDLTESIRLTARR